MIRFLLLCFLALPALAEPMEVDLELVLAVDTSRSMDRDELLLQRLGYADALEHPTVTARIADGLLGRIAITYFDWGGGNHEVIVPWRVLETPQDAADMAEELRIQPVTNRFGTGLSGAIMTGIYEIENNAYEGLRAVIDVSGDGPNNVGIPVLDARAEAAKRNITINGLPIMIKKPGGWYNIENLDIYYQDCVVSGPGSFVMPVHDYEKLVTSITRKLVLEIAGLVPQAIPRIYPTSRTDCLIGEKLRRRWMEP